ncbi:MAG TPA: ATPase, T2SS/T4P/T4SS family, partial [Labilithrix sp.]
LEFGLVTNRLPSVNIGGKFEPVDDEAPTTEKLLAMLVAMGGSRHVDALSEKPVQWTTRLDGVGVIAVAAIMRKDVVQARFTVARRDPPGGRASVPPQAATASVQPAAAARPAAKDAAPATAQRAPFATTQQGTGPGQARSPLAQSTVTAGASAAAASGVQPAARPAAAQQTQQSPPQAATAAARAAPSTPMQQAASAAKAQAQAAVVAQQAIQAKAPPPPPSPAPPQQEEWEDDDEPTVQTLSPPVQPTPGVGPVEAKPKPARKPDQVSRDTGPLASAAPQSPAGGPRTERVPPPDAAEIREAAAVEEPRARAPEAKPAEARPADKRPSDRALEAQSGAPPAIPKEEPRRQVSVRPIAQSAPAPAPSPAPPQVEGPRRINTPTSVDAVDVEITTSDHGGKRKPLVLDLEADRDSTVEMTPAQVIAKQTPPEAPARQRPVTAAIPSAVPSTSPSAGGTPDKDSPRGDAGLDAFLGMAVAARATDMHVIAGRPMLLRVATDLLPRTQAVPAEVVERIVRECVPARLRETLEADGSCEFAIDHPQHGRFRTNVSRQRSGWKLSMRCIPREVPTLASLGLPSAIAAATTHQQGLVLVTGPAGNGKTSTLAAVVDQLNAETAHHILTIEDPVEYVHPRKRALMSHREVGASARTYPHALRAAVREDPDVIVVGELRDAESARLAIRASETGHLVLATMNTPSAAKTIDRLIELFPASEQQEIRFAIAGALRMLIGQRLVPSADRTRLFVAAELLPSSIALYTLIRDGRTYQIPSLQQRGRG